MNGALLKKWMTEHNVKAEDLAVRMGVSYPTVKNMLAGKRPYRTTITVLAQIMGVSEDDLMAEPKQDPGGKRAAG